MKTFEACYMSAGEYNPSKGGFKTEREAWDFVYDRMCESCQEAHKTGGVTHCDAEWVIAEEDNKKVIS